MALTCLDPTGQRPLIGRPKVLPLVDRKHGHKGKQNRVEDDDDDDDDENDDEEMESDDGGRGSFFDAGKTNLLSIRDPDASEEGGYDPSN